MTALSSLAMRHQLERIKQSDRATNRVMRLWRLMDPADLDASWDAIAPLLEREVSVAQVAAASSATGYVSKALGLQGAEGAVVEPQSFAGVTREGREVVPELYAAVTTTKRLIGAGSGVAAAFSAGATVMSLLVGTVIRDSGIGADKVASAPVSSVSYIRVIQPGACSRCAILAGRDNYRNNFERHPRCKCTLMPIHDWSEFPDEGFYLSARNYFDDLSVAEQDRVFTKSGAWAIRNGADPVKVVNARRGALKSTKRADGSYSMASLRPKTIGVRKDGSPLRVFVTPEGNTARSSWARQQNDLLKFGDDKYRRTKTFRLMPEQIFKMSGGNAERAVELLHKYGYLAR